MTDQQAKAMMEREAAKGTEPYIYRDYSGRGMFGEKTTALVVHSRPVKTRFRVDRLGLDWIIY